MAQGHNDELDDQIRQQLLTFTQNLDGLIQQLREASDIDSAVELMESMSELVDGQLAELRGDDDDDLEDEGVGDDDET